MRAALTLVLAVLATPAVAADLNVFVPPDLPKEGGLIAMQ